MEASMTSDDDDMDVSSTSGDGDTVRDDDELLAGMGQGTILLADRTIGRAYGTVCRLSVRRLSVCPSSVTFCIVAKRCVLAKKCLKE